MTASARMIALRPPAAADRDRVRGLVEATSVFRPDEVEIAVEVYDGATNEPGIDYRGLGAYDEDLLTGFTLFGPTPGTVSTWDLYWIVVDPAGQRLGIGRRLMEATEREISAAGGRLIVVETSSRPDYAPTRAFYEALGYGQTARIPDYYAQQDDLIVFTKRLSPPSAEIENHG